MPIYEYQCTDCESRFEKLFLSQAAVETGATCNSCGGDHVERVHSTFAAQAAGDSMNACGVPSGENCGAPACGGGMCGMN